MQQVHVWADLVVQVSDMYVRLAELADAKRLQSLSGLLGYPYPLEKLTVNLATSLADVKHLILVAEHDGLVLGYCHAEYYEPLYADKLLNVLGLVVDASYQGQGIGSALLDAIASYALEKGILAIRLNSGEDRGAAHCFYEKNGYISNKQQKNFIKRLG